jgi:multicomponent Na+:H+ antiporter subunit D
VTIAPLTVAVPLLVAAALAAANFAPRRWIADPIAVATGLAATTFCAILLVHSVGGTTVYWMSGWEPRHGVAVGISLSIDTLGAGMATLVGVIVTGALIFSARYFETVGNLFHALMLVFMAAMLGFCLTGDLFNLFVFFELMSGAAYALTAYEIEERGPLQGAINFAVTNSVAAFTILIGIGLLYARTGALNLAQIGEALAGHGSDTLVAVAMLLIVVGFLVKAAAVPVHFWLADAHAVAPTPVCVLFSGVMVELGLYAVARIYWTVFAAPMGDHVAAVQWILVLLGTLTALVGAVMCFQQRHLKRLLAFSTVSHVGLFLMGLGLVTEVGLAGAATYIVSHGLGKAALFMCVGILIHRFAEVDEPRLRGRGKERGLKVVGVVFAAGGLLIAGTPMLGTFFGKSLIETSALEQGFPWLPAVMMVTSGITGAAILRAAGTIFGGWGEDEPPPSEQPAEKDVEFETRKPHDRTPVTMLAPAIALMAAAFVVGLVPGLVHGIERASTGFVDTSAYAATVLHGAPSSLPAVQATPLTGYDFAYGAGALAIALGVAALALFGRPLLEPFPDFSKRSAAAAMEGLRALHSGHVGDYIAWLTASLGGLGAVFLLLLR